ncbi:MAG: carbamate kinase [Actinobacteria bacterium]|nr:carbamate kinase [Actinomycetota bacterium]
MRIVIALGGNALLRRGEPMTPDVQRANVRLAAQALAPVAVGHEVVLSHGNGPQVGLLALQAAACQEAEPYPLDVLGAQSEGMIGYLIEQELGNLMAPAQPFATILTMVQVDPADPAFREPTKFIGPLYLHEEAASLGRAKRWSFKKDGAGWRRVVPSPAPRRIFEIRPIKWLIEKGVIVICAGGGGIPTIIDENGDLRGVEAVIDKDLAGSLLARELDADLFVMATDVAGVYLDWGSAHPQLLRDVTPQDLRTHVFPAGSMGPKVEAACRFVERTGHRAVIGAIGDIEDMVQGIAGTQVRAVRGSA